jgi:hypothetical protein
MRVIKPLDFLAKLAGGILFVIAISSQAVAQPPKAWTGIEDSVGKISFEIPEDFVFDKDGDRISLYGYANGASLNVIFDTLKNPKKTVKNYNFPSAKDTKVEKTEIGDFAIRKLITDSADGYSVTIYAGSSNAYFAVTGSAETKDNPAILQLMNSLNLDGVYMNGNPNKAVPVSLKHFKIDKLTPSPEVITALSKPDNPNTTVKYQMVREENVIKYSRYSRGLIILRKPRPGYTEDARMKGIQGTVRAKVDFLKTGEIGEIVVDYYLDGALSQKVGEAIKKIKFIPAEVDGKPIDVKRIVTYSFSLY